ncbi:MAG: c-type cytochrome, partial [Rhizobiales bacterium]|nr:c-type cytochrome [Hyphomicrobiales bacterium]
MPAGSNTIVATGIIRLIPDEQSAVQRGAALYQANCASCHGANLEGETNWRRPTTDGRR